MFSSVMITEWNFLIWSLNAPLVMKSRLHSEQEWLGGTNPSPCILAECSRSLCMRVKPLPEFFFLKKIIHYFVLQLLSKIISQKKTPWKLTTYMTCEILFVHMNTFNMVLKWLSIFKGFVTLVTQKLSIMGWNWISSDPWCCFFTWFSWWACFVPLMLQ